MLNSTLDPSARPVKQDFDLGPFVIECHQEAFPDELVYIPTCNGYEEPLTEPDQANLVTEDWDDEAPMTPAGHVDGLPLLRHPGRVTVYHFACDSGGKPWRHLSTVLRKNQRWEWER